MLAAVGFQCCIVSVISELQAADSDLTLKLLPIATDGLNHTLS
jgi:hypothetical protein